MLKCCAFVFLLTVLLLMARSASAQLLPGLPEVNGINASGQIGTIWSPKPFSTVPNTSLDQFDLWGWGVETEFHLPFNEGSPWEASLAVGYNQLSLSADIDKGRRLRGTLRDLPALSLYFGRAKRAWYVGVTIAESELINGRLIRRSDPGVFDPGPIKIAASSFSAGLALGYEAGPVFFELGYVGRYFPSVQYDGIPAGTSFPADLGERMYAGGFVVRVGVTLDLKKTAPPKSTILCGDAKTEITPPAGREFNATCAGDSFIVNIRKAQPATPATPAPVTPVPVTPAPATPAPATAPPAPVPPEAAPAPRAY